MDKSFDERSFFSVAIPVKACLVRTKVGLAGVARLCWVKAMRSSEDVPRCNQSAAAAVRGRVTLDLGVERNNPRVFVFGSILFNNMAGVVGLKWVKWGEMRVSFVILYLR